MNWRVSSSARRQQLLPFIGSSRAAASTAPKRRGCRRRTEPPARRAAAARRPPGPRPSARSHRHAADRSGSAASACSTNGLPACAAGARDEVDQLPPAHRTVVRVARRLVQHRHQAIVEPHQLNSASLRETWSANRSIRRPGARKAGPLTIPKWHMLPITREVLFWRNSALRGPMLRNRHVPELVFSSAPPSGGRRGDSRGEP